MEYNTVIICDECGKSVKHDGIGTGYGITKEGKKHCYTCCAEFDKKELRETGELTGYLTGKEVTYRGRKVQYGQIFLEQGFFGNWCGTFKVPIYKISRSRNNFGATRDDFWFSWEGNKYHGICFSDNQEIAKVKRIKR